MDERQLYVILNNDTECSVVKKLTECEAKILDWLIEWADIDCECITAEDYCKYDF